VAPRDKVRHNRGYESLRECTIRRPSMGQNGVFSGSPPVVPSGSKYAPESTIRPPIVYDGSSMGSSGVLGLSRD